MKCETVQELATEYREGALGAADEMCVDIHLIQCETCRGELEMLDAMATLFASEIDGRAPAGDVLALLDEIDGAPPARPHRGTMAWASVAGLAFRVTAVLVVTVWVLAAGLSVDWDGNAAGFLGPASAQVGSEHALDQSWRIQLRGEQDLVDLDALGLSRAGSARAGTDGV